MPEGLETYKFFSILHVSELFLLPPGAIVIVLKSKRTLCCDLLNTPMLTLYRNSSARSFMFSNALFLNSTYILIRTLMTQLVLTFLLGLPQLGLTLVFVVDVLEQIVHDNFIGPVDDLFKEAISKGRHHILWRYLPEYTPITVSHLSSLDCNWLSKPFILLLDFRRPSQSFLRYWVRSSSCFFATLNALSNLLASVWSCSLSMPN